MWKVRYRLADGDIGETQFTGSLTDIAAAMNENVIVVIQRVALPAVEAPKDKAKGSSAVSVKKK